MTSCLQEEIFLHKIFLERSWIRKNFILFINTKKY